MLRVGGFASRIQCVLKGRMLSREASQGSCWFRAKMLVPTLFSEPLHCDLCAHLRALRDTCNAVVTDVIQHDQSRWRRAAAVCEGEIKLSNVN